MTVFDPYLRNSVGEADCPVQEAGPIVWSEEAQAWLVTRFEDVSAVLRDPLFEAFNLHEAFARIIARAGIDLPDLHRFIKASLIFKAGPDHVPLRRLLSRTLNNQPLSSLGAAMRKMAQGLWENCITRGECDIVREYAETFPSMVIGSLLGLNETQRQSFFAATYGLMGVYNRGCSIARYRDFDGRLGILRVTIDKLFEERRQRQCADGLSTFLDEAAILGLSDDEAAANLTFLYLAGVDQTSALISLGVRRLILQPALAAAVKDATIPETVLIEELLRIESPAPQVIRVATSNVTIGGAKIATGDTLILLLSCANNDSDHFAKAGRVEQGRKRNLAFSEGAHACIGSTFARLELAAALAPVIAATPTAIDRAPPQWWPLDATRRMRTLLVRFT